MSIVQLPFVRQRSWLPILAMVDLQMEYSSEGRAPYIEGAEGAIANCAILLSEARRLRLPIAHFRLFQRGPFFNRASAFANWVDAVKPRTNEYIYERELPSCFTSDGFCNLISAIENPTIILAGLSGERACLSTMIDCYHRDCNVTYVKDCSASSVICGVNEACAHAMVCKLASLYGEVVSLGEVVGRLSEVRTRWGSG